MDVLGAVTTLAVGGATLWLGLRQWVNVQAWKRAEFVADEYRRFAESPRVAAALVMLDWSERTMDVPPNAVVRGWTRAFHHHHEKFEEALRDHATLRPGEVFTPEEVVLRDTFDALFDGLQRFEHHIQRKLVAPDDLRPYVTYHVKIIADSTSTLMAAGPREALQRYAEAYFSPGVPSFLRRFHAGYTAPSSPPPAAKAAESSS